MNSANQSSSPTWKNNRWLVLVTISIGTFMSTLDGSIANVALNTISNDLKAPLTIAQWVLTAYLLTICATLPIMGKISDLIGRSKVYNYGFLLFALGSAFCGLSPTLGTLIASRILQAIGASCLMSNSQAIVTEVFPAAERGRAIGIVGTMVSLGSLTGPGIGGILVAHFGWASIFWINVPIGIIAFISGLFLLPSDKKRTEREPFDYTGSGLFILGMISFLYTINNAQSWGWSSFATVTGGIVAVLLLAAFYLWERRTRYPMLDFTLYRNRTFTLGSITAFLSFVAIFFTNVMIPIYMQTVLHYTPKLTGYTMMMYPITMAVIAPLSGWLSDKYGPNVLTTLGLLINALGFGLLTNLTQHESPWVVGLHLALFGIGGGLFQSPNNSSVLGSAPRAKLGTASSLNALVRNLGMVLGTSLSVSIYSTRLAHLQSAKEPLPSPEATLSSLHTVFWVAMGVCLLALLISAQRMLRKPKALSD